MSDYKDGTYDGMYVDKDGFLSRKMKTNQEQMPTEK
jgi:hypothetical protein